MPMFTSLPFVGIGKHMVTAPSGCHGYLHALPKVHIPPGLATFQSSSLGDVLNKNILFCCGTCFKNNENSL